MIRSLIACTALAGAAALFALPAEAKGSCTRAQLQAAAESYIAAQAAGDPSKAKLAKNAAYKEEFKPADIKTGILSQPLKVDFHQNLLDTAICETFTQVVVTDKKHPYVLGVHLTAPKGKISEIDTIVTDDDDWLFSAERFLNGIKDEDWGPIPKKERASREAIIAAADPYFAMFKNVAIQPKWHEPCYRQEGGMRTDGKCSLSTPLNVEFPPRHYVVDPEIGAVVGLVMFGNREPDAHTFRVEDGKVRFIHTITNCVQYNCGFDLSKELLAERQARGGMLPPPKKVEAAQPAAPAPTTKSSPTNK
jgi:hypothetical protein